MRSLRLSLTYANVVSTLCLFIVLGGGADAATKLPRNSVGSTQIKNDAVSSSKVKDASLLRTDFKPGELASGEHGAAGPSGERGPAGPPGSDAQFNGAAAGGALTGAYPAPTLSCPAGTSFQSGFCFETSARAGADWAAAATTCATAGRRLATPSELWAVARRSDVSMTAAEWTSTAYNYVDSPVGYEMATTVFEIVAGPGTGIHIGHALDDAMVAYRCVVDAGSA